MIQDNFTAMRILSKIACLFTYKKEKRCVLEVLIVLVLPLEKICPAIG